MSGEAAACCCGSVSIDKLSCIASANTNAISIKVAIIVLRRQANAAVDPRNDEELTLVVARTECDVLSNESAPKQMIADVHVFERCATKERRALRLHTMLRRAVAPRDKQGWCIGEG